MKLLTLFVTLVTLVCLSSCGPKVRGVPRVELTIPVRPALRPVEVFACGKDEKCPSGTSFCMNTLNFQNLQENVINSEAYIDKLLNILRSLNK